MPLEIFYDKENAFNIFIYKKMSQGTFKETHKMRDIIPDKIHTESPPDEDGASAFRFYILSIFHFFPISNRQGSTEKNYITYIHTE